MLPQWNVVYLARSSARTAAMDVDANKRLVERFYEQVWARGNVSFAEEVFSEDYMRHDLRPTQAAPGAAGQARIADQFRHAFPDLHWRVDLVLGERDLVAARWTASGTQTGSWGDLAPTGRWAEFSGVNIFRFGEDGKVAEIWNHRDDLGLMEQLGAGVFAGPAADQS
jgi:steroid delta-isomerase-like uncharacterized protein